MSNKMVLFVARYIQHGDETLAAWEAGYHKCPAAAKGPICFHKSTGKRLLNNSQVKDLLEAVGWFKNNGCPIAETRNAKLQIENAIKYLNKFAELL